MEEKEITAQDFMNVLELRSDLVYCSFDDLKEAFQDDDVYINVMHTLYQLIDIDNGGFAIIDNEITEKIYKLLNFKRYEIKNKNKETYNLINDTILKLNEVNALSDEVKTEFIDNYAVNQEENRGLEFRYKYELLDSMAIDSFIIDYLEGEEMPDDIPDYYIIGSIVYLNNTMPGLFEIEEVQNKIDDLLCEMSMFKKEEKPSLVERIVQKVLRR